MVVMRVRIEFFGPFGNIVKRLVARIALRRFDGGSGLRRLDTVTGFTGDTAFNVTVGEEMRAVLRGLGT